MTIHPAAKPFSRALRERIAHGPLYDRCTGPTYARDDVGSCLWLDLSDAELHNALKVPEHAENDLIARNDTGYYAGPAGRAHLIADLLGEEGGAE